MRKQSEYDNFDHTMRELLKVSHLEIKASLDAEKVAKKQNKSKRVKKS